jgi:hypothetical protein
MFLFHYLTRDVEYMNSWLNISLIRNHICILIYTLHAHDNGSLEAKYIKVKF